MSKKLSSPDTIFIDNDFRKREMHKSKIVHVENAGEHKSIVYDINNVGWKYGFNSSHLQQLFPGYFYSMGHGNLVNPIYWVMPKQDKLNCSFILLKNNEKVKFTEAIERKLITYRKFIKHNGCHKCKNQLCIINMLNDEKPVCKKQL